MDSMREDMFLTNRRTHMKPLIRPKSSAQVIFVLKINRVGKWDRVDESLDNGMFWVWSIPSGIMAKNLC